MTNSITKQHTLPTSPAADWLEYSTIPSDRSDKLLYVAGHIDKETHAEMVRACDIHDSAVDKLYAVYVTETERLACGKSNYAPTFIEELEYLLCVMDAELMWSNHGKSIAKAEGGAK